MGGAAAAWNGSGVNRTIGGEEEALANASGALAGCADNITGGTGRVLEGPTFMRMILAGQFLDDNADDTDAGGTRRYLTVVLSCYGGGGRFSI